MVFDHEYKTCFQFKASHIYNNVEYLKSQENFWWDVDISNDCWGGDA